MPSLAHLVTRCGWRPWAILLTACLAAPAWSQAPPLVYSLDGANFALNALYDSTSTTVYVPSFPGYVKTVALDSVEQRLFFFDPDVGKILSCNLDGSGQEGVKGETDLLDLAYHDGKVYYARKSGAFDLRRCNVDGTGDEQLYTPTDSIHGFVKAFAIDPVTQKLFFYDPRDEMVYRANLDGSDRSKLKSVKNLFDLAVYEGDLYYALQDGAFDLRRCRVEDPADDVRVIDPRDHVKRFCLDPQTRRIYLLDPMPRTAPATSPWALSRTNLDGGGRTDVIDEDCYDLGVLVSASEIGVAGNGLEIPHGDISPNPADCSDFGPLLFSADPIVHTFTIRNSGSENLTLTLPVQVTGTDFSIASQPSLTTLGPHESTTFELRFDALDGGLRPGQVRSTSDDKDESSYTFLVQGTGRAPEMRVSGRGVEIADGDTEPSPVDDTHFGTVDLVDGALVTHVFTIENTGSADLSLSGTPLVSSDNPEFSVTLLPDTPLPPTQSTTFLVAFQPSSAGPRTAEILLVNDDADENPYTFTVGGVGSGHDFGDAPYHSYPTLLNQDGARHRVPSPLFLGGAVDAETDGQPDTAATGDDLADGDDEDGVTLNSTLVPGANTALVVTANAAGLLNAWIDFNQNGSWNDPGEHIFTNQALTAGPNTLTLGVPAWAPLGFTYARFRLSSAGNDAPTGPAEDGEVEDYRFFLTEPRIQILRDAAGNLILIWPDGYNLESAPDITGPWSPVSGSISPFTLPTPLPAEFFRSLQ